MNKGYDLGTLISVIKTDVIELVNAKIEYYKLEMFEKVSSVGSLLVYGLIVINLVFFAFLFGFLALGFLISDWVGSVAGGFGIVALLYLIIMAVLFALRKPILKVFQNIFLKELDPDLEDEARYEEKCAQQRSKAKKERRQRMRDWDEDLINKYKDLYELD
ncbi:putative membrane protein YqjE [Dysgonomonadaceae bacterium PH5-43]|nr:putative membrane protein YqjE [Dysgonomonadaceae bacterium PH5-43]